MSTQPIHPAPSSPWLIAALESLRGEAGTGVAYVNGGSVASEPTALAALALAENGFATEAVRMGETIAQWQAADGSVGVQPGVAKPGWPTSLAVLAWQAVNSSHFAANIARGREWLLVTKGEPVEKTPDLGHDTSLIGWSWAEKTHSWMEPTAFAVLALRATGEGANARTREAIRLLNDRLLDSGGCNYGNTTVLGNELRAHVQPTGIVLLALGGTSANSKLEKSIQWLAANVNAETTASSLAWGLLGLRAHGVVPAGAEAWLAQAAARVMHRDQSCAKLSLLALARKGWPTAAIPERGA